MYHKNPDTAEHVHTRDPLAGHASTTHTELGSGQRELPCLGVRDVAAPIFDR